MAHQPAEETAGLSRLNTTDIGNRYRTMARGKRTSVVGTCNINSVSRTRVPARSPFPHCDSDYYAISLLSPDRPILARFVSITQDMFAKVMTSNI